jgi:hypothetical protein
MGGGLPPLKKFEKLNSVTCVTLFTSRLPILPHSQISTAFSSAILLCMTFLQSADANVHIAAIVFFDMLATADLNPAQHQFRQKQGRVR